MKGDFARPRLFASKCLGFAACRWDGVAITDDFIESLKSRADFVTACPEVQIGLGVPRDPIRLVSGSGKCILTQPATGRDVSDEMRSFAGQFLESLGKVDGFILKDRSPSCGIRNVKVYPSLESPDPIAETDGFFAGEVLKRFPGVPVETETTLADPVIRKRFLSRVFPRCCKENMGGSIDGL